MNGRNENKILKSYSHGDTFALMKVAKELGTEEILDDVFPSRTRKGVSRSTCLLLIALQSICNPGSKSGFELWLKNTTLPYDCNLQALDFRRIWEQMDSISAEELAKAEDRITGRIFEKHNFELDKIALDYTNYFSCISSSNDKKRIVKTWPQQAETQRFEAIFSGFAYNERVGLATLFAYIRGQQNR